MKAYKKIILLVFGVAGGAALCFVGLIVYLNWPTDRTLAKDVAVTSDWTEFTIEPALTQSHRDQYIKLQIKGYSWDTNPGSIDGPLKLADGALVEPQIELRNSAGEVQTLRHSGGVRKWVDEAVFRPAAEIQDRHDHEFTKIRIRSNVPFACERISWVDYDPK